MFAGLGSTTSPTPPASTETKSVRCVAAGLASASEHALVSLLAINGLRVSEALGADIAALGIERGLRTLTVLREGGKVVTIPLAPVGKPKNDDPRENGPTAGVERTALVGPLRGRRLTLETKWSGLDAEALARRSVEPSSRTSR